MTKKMIFTHWDDFETTGQESLKGKLGKQEIPLNWTFEVNYFPILVSNTGNETISSKAI